MDLIKYGTVSNSLFMKDILIQTEPKTGRVEHQLLMITQFANLKPLPHFY